jgi:hypothetical protein
VTCGIKLEQSKVLEIQRRWSSGEHTMCIANQLQTSRRTVERYCEGLHRTMINPLNVSERQRLLESWK